MYIWDEVIKIDDPLGKKIIHAPVIDSFRIDISDGVSKVKAVMNDQNNSTGPDFSKIRDAFPPLTSKNLFIDFDARGLKNVRNDTSRIGVHIVDWNVCGPKYRAFQQIPLVDKSLYEEVFGLAFYFQDQDVLKYWGIGVRVGLGKTGGLDLVDFFYPVPPLKALQSGRVKSLKEFLSGKVFLIFSAFSDINSELFLLERLAPKIYAAKENRCQMK
jgi:hypothetical protein